MTRQCFMCKKTFSTDMFYADSNNKFFSYCKPCHKIKNTEKKLNLYK
jgi:hypothetical protein